MHFAGAAPLRTVFVDAAPLAERHLTGIGRYTARLSLALQELLGPDRLRFFAHADEILPPPGLSREQDQDLASWAKSIWRASRKPLTSFDIPTDSVGLFCCLRGPQRRFPYEVSVLHDFSTLLLPWTHSSRNIGTFQPFFSESVLRCDHAIADSEATRSDASWLCDLCPDQVSVASPGPSLCVRRHLHEGRVARRPEVGLVVATLEPRKNARFLLEWFLSSESLPDSSELWWVGAVGWLSSRRALRSLQRGVRGRTVKYLGVVSDATLCRLYQTAGWSAYPSLYEGFGFPVLDSLRHGTPVLASYNSSLCEIDHPGVYFFDPYNTDTVESAWREMRSPGDAASVISPQSHLDSRYCWEAVAQAIVRLNHSSQVEGRAA